jgi:hypothetical protein
MSIPRSLTTSAGGSKRMSKSDISDVGHQIEKHDQLMDRLREVFGGPESAYNDFDDGPNSDEHLQTEAQKPLEALPIKAARPVLTAAVLRQKWRSANAHIKICRILDFQVALVRARLSSFYKAPNASDKAVPFSDKVFINKVIQLTQIRAFILSKSRNSEEIRSLSLSMNVSLRSFKLFSDIQKSVICQIMDYQNVPRVQCLT